MRMRRAGRSGLLVELGNVHEVMALAAELRRRALPGVVDIVPAARTVLVMGPGTVLEALAEEMPRWELAERAASAAPPVEIPVVYDGPDLDEVCERTHLTRERLVALHTGVTLTVAFCGFTPGFAYLAGLPEVLHVPRRATPRTKVDPGSVGLAGEFTGVYPRASPGGWQLIGRTALALWDERRDPPNLLAPGTRVRFVTA